MGIVRTLLIVVAIFIALIIIKRLMTGRTPAAPPTQAQAPKLVQCAHCGLHVDPSQALRSGEHYDCSADHQQRGEKN